MSPAHIFTLKGIVHGFPEWNLECTHDRTSPEWFPEGETECWLQSWWEAEDVTLVHLPDAALRVPVAPIDWFDEPGHIGRDPGPACITVIHKWDDTFAPTCTHSDVRVAALQLLNDFDPESWFEHHDYYCDEAERIFPDVFTRAGFCDIFARASSPECRSYRRQFNSLHAWITAHLEQHWWCGTCCEESGEETVPFDECYGDEDENVHEDFAPLWALNADPADFIRFAAAMLRETAS